MSTKKTIVLKSSDGELFEVDEAVALQSTTIARQVEDDCVEGGIRLANVSSKILKIVIEYCKKHVVVVDGVGSSSSSEDLKKWDAEFMPTDPSTVFDLILAANFLDIASLLDLACHAVSGMIEACKDEKEIRAKLNIENDFTAAEEEKAREENKWAF